MLRNLVDDQEKKRKEIKESGSRSKIKKMIEISRNELMKPSPGHKNEQVLLFFFDLLLFESLKNKRRRSLSPENVIVC